MGWRSGASWLGVACRGSWTPHGLDAGRGIAESTAGQRKSEVRIRKSQIETAGYGRNGGMQQKGLAWH